MVIAEPRILSVFIGSVPVKASFTGQFLGNGSTPLHSSGGSSVDLPSLVVSIVAALIALVAVIYSVKYTHSAQDAAVSLGNAQLLQQSEQQPPPNSRHRFSSSCARDAVLPYVWVDVRPDDVTDVLLNLVVGNSGPTIAQNVRATIDPPLTAIDQLRDRAETAQDLLSRGISSLPPGRTLVWPLGQGFNILAGEGPKRHVVTVTADGPFGPMPPLTYVLDPTDYQGHMHRPVGSMHLLTKAFENIGDKLGHAAAEADQN